MTKIELTDENGKYTIEIDRIDMPWFEVVDYLVTPVLRAAGYTVDGGTIKDIVGDGQDSDEI